MLFEVDTIFAGTSKSNSKIFYIKSSVGSSPTPIERRKLDETEMKRSFYEV